MILTFGRLRRLVAGIQSCDMVSRGISHETLNWNANWIQGDGRDGSVVRGVKGRGREICGLGDGEKVGRQLSTRRMTKKERCSREIYSAECWLNYWVEGRGCKQGGRRRGREMSDETRLRMDGVFASSGSGLRTAGPGPGVGMCCNLLVSLLAGFWARLRLRVRGNDYRVEKGASRNHGSILGGEGREASDFVHLEPFPGGCRKGPSPPRSPVGAQNRTEQVADDRRGSSREPNSTHGRGYYIMDINVSTSMSVADRVCPLPNKYQTGTHRRKEAWSERTMRSSMATYEVRNGRHAPFASIHHPPRPGHTSQEASCLSPTSGVCVQCKYPVSVSLGKWVPGCVWN